MRLPLFLLASLANLVCVSLVPTDPSAQQQNRTRTQQQAQTGTQQQYAKMSDVIKYVQSLTNRYFVSKSEMKSASADYAKLSDLEQLKKDIKADMVEMEKELNGSCNECTEEQYGIDPYGRPKCRVKRKINYAYTTCDAFCGYGKRVGQRDCTLNKEEADGSCSNFTTTDHVECGLQESSMRPFNATCRDAVCTIQRISERTKSTPGAGYDYQISYKLVVNSSSYCMTYTNVKRPQGSYKTTTLSTQCSTLSLGSNEFFTEVYARRWGHGAKNDVWEPDYINVVVNGRTKTFFGTGPVVDGKWTKLTLTRLPPVVTQPKAPVGVPPVVSDTAVAETSEDLETTAAAKTSEDMETTAVTETSEDLETTAAAETSEDAGTAAAGKTSEDTGATAVPVV